MAIPRPHHRFTVDEYEEMIRVGILQEDDRVELVQGEIVEMSPVGGRHVKSVGRFNRLLSRQAGEDLLVQVQSPIRLSDNSEPEPDLAVVQDREYGRGLPTPADVLLVVEVADSSLEYDRDTKLDLYAAADIPEGWLADLQHGRLWRYSEPRAGAYRLIVMAGRGESLPSTVLPGLVVPVDVVLP